MAGRTLTSDDAGATPGHARHPVWLRLTHWLQAVAIGALVVSGIAILLALPRLFWGETGANEAPAWLDLPLPVNLEQTGWGRNLHFLAAWVFVLNGLVYLALLLATGRIRRLLPRPRELRWRHMAEEVRRHLRPGAAAPAGAGYNVLQKLAYLGVVVGLGPVLVLSGLTMSPAVTVAYPELFWLFGGRQSARTIHFFAACAMILFVLVHVWQVFANGPRALLRGMTIGGRERQDG